jgi:S-DNA-T family DNA segregation ATPase FtsK/SpoIIIE
LNVSADSLEMLERDRTGKDVAAPLGRADSLSVVQAEGLALKLAPLRIGSGEQPEQNVLATNLTLTSLLGLRSPYEIDLRTSWQPRAPRNRLRVPIGVDADGRAVELDIKESAQGGMGPHGLLIGATGAAGDDLRDAGALRCQRLTQELIVGERA